MDPVVTAAALSSVGVIVTAVLHTRATRRNAATEAAEKAAADAVEATLQLRDERLRAYAEQLGAARIALAEARAERDAALNELERLRRPHTLSQKGRS